MTLHLDCNRKPLVTRKGRSMNPLNSVLKSALTLAGAALLGAVAHADGLNPGSLLIYPEYDSTTSHNTLITVTNTSQTLTIRVKFEYVSPLEPVCLLTDREATLTPNDTLTVLVSAHIGAGRRGFLYVFAIGTGGAAISANFLVGDNLVIDGANSLQYAINPLVFRAVPTLNSSTDLDNDGIRDLDGNEYEPAPGRILIPRFMGQSTSHTSDLILIGLSGGGRFHTIADFVVFNDNEVPLSAQYEFPCWERVPLLTINGVFARSFLANNTDDAAAEILGQNSYESGWMIIQGTVAQSANTAISDPAILAVLVERTGTRAGAELPFIQGRRTNGALFPQSNTGNGP
jgi:hypothetical protein